MHKVRNAEGELVWTDDLGAYRGCPILETADRAPGRHEDMVGGKWKRDDRALAAFAEECRLRGMTASERHEEAVSRAEQQLLAKLERVGAISAQHAAKIRADK